MDKKKLKLIRQFAGLENYNGERVRGKGQVILPQKKQDEMLSLVYAPDPVTGLPSSDIGMLLKHKDKPEVQQYIQQRLNNAHEHIAGSSSADDALKAIRGYKEDVRSYAERIRNEFKPVDEVAGESEE